MTHFSWDIRSESLELPFSYFYVSIPLGALLAVFYLGKRIRKNWAGQGGSEK
jgi:TRAP-type C4-dicarboxylate transport system permease small subunit